MTMRCYHITSDDKQTDPNSEDTIRLAMRGVHFRAEPDKTAKELEEDEQGVRPAARAEVVSAKRQATEACRA